MTNSLTPLAVAAFALIYVSAFLPYHKPEPPKPVPVFGKITDPRFIAPEQFRAWIMADCAEFGVPLDVGIRLPFEESGFTQYITRRNRNGTYDHDVFQLNSRYHYVMTTRGNIHEGIRQWAWCWRQTGSVYKATLAYICGLEGSATPSARAKQEARAVAIGSMNL